MDCILGKGDWLFKCIGKFRYYGIEDLPKEFFIDHYSINVEFLDNKTGEITAGEYLVSITEIKNSVQSSGTVALLIVSKYSLGLIWGNDSTIYLLDSHGKDENLNLSSFGTPALLETDILHSQ